MSYSATIPLRCPQTYSRVRSRQARANHRVTAVRPHACSFLLAASLPVLNMYTEHAGFVYSIDLFVLSIDCVARSRGLLFSLLNHRLLIICHIFCYPMPKTHNGR